MKTVGIEAFAVASARASLSVSGQYHPDVACVVGGVVTVAYTATVPQDAFKGEGRLRAAEDAVAMSVLEKLATFDRILAERDRLLAEKNARIATEKPCSGYSTAEMMAGDCG